MGGAALVEGRVRRDLGPVMREVCDELESDVARWFESAQMPFRCIHVIVRLGTKAESTPHYGPVDAGHSELPVAIVLSFETINAMSQSALKASLLDLTARVFQEVSEQFASPLPDRMKQRLPKKIRL